MIFGFASADEHVTVTLGQKKVMGSDHNEECFNLI